MATEEQILGWCNLLRDLFPEVASFSFTHDGQLMALMGPPENQEEVPCRLELSFDTGYHINATFPDHTIVHEQVFPKASIADVQVALHPCWCDCGQHVPPMP